MPLIEVAAYYGWLPEESATKSAQAGDKAGRRWSEQEWMQAAQITYLQTIISILWVGQRLKGRPPKSAPVSVPVYARPDPTPEEKAKQDAHLARVAALRKYSPSYRPPADDPP
ncbi:hypothetical protein [Actinomadura madurae]|uniref:hypothetical protein n=1 Tax=Actinomadura madurae TaxID=1993 RepID=UPI0020D2238C|nr:hypothetical protein [Actinomadura madurae]MCP9947280.1 hypothetical protein [Actinomadura madurae]MCP9964043.1 hypothetical protein [Actinomadura madurae]MCP9976518.1 hypothetical protein [Actinomadura madurae]MCQ0011986.1 hypothetical protein [Actinomadura madurae]MCQ0012713.1 hypothetical protein [Actinomadura madurae]